MLSCAEDKGRDSETRELRIGNCKKERSRGEMCKGNEIEEDGKRQMYRWRPGKRWKRAGTRESVVNGERRREQLLCCVLVMCSSWGTWDLTV